jgi:uncharacterized glyoxalase superfamily protein PhnB
MTYPTIFPSLRYDDAHAAIDFLVRAFDAEPHAIYTADDGTIRHAEIRLGNGIVMLGTSRPDAPATRGGGGIYVVVKDADSHHARARSAGAEIVRGLDDTDYGSRGYSTLDPEGNAWHFGTYQPFAVDHEAERIARASSGGMR